MSQEYLKKEAQILEKDPVYVAETLEKIIRVMIAKISVDKRPGAILNIRDRLQGFNVMEISSKKAPGGAAIGASLGLLKNVLNSSDPYFINIVLKELYNRLQ